MSVIPSDVAYYGSLYDPAYDGAATLNGAAAVCWMPRRTAAAKSVSPGQESTAIAARSVMVP